LVTPLTFAQQLKVELASQWNLAIMKKYPETLLRQLLRKARAKSSPVNYSIDAL
jgi:hypothetical protein